jgi:GDP-L-fucose synthase
MALPKPTYVQHTQAMLSHINVGCGEDLSIADLARAIADVVGYSGDIQFDLSKLDGTPRKLMDSSRLRSLGWKPRIDLPSGLADTYLDFVEKHA